MAHCLISLDMSRVTDANDKMVSNRVCCDATCGVIDGDCNNMPIGYVTIAMK